MTERHTMCNAIKGGANKCNIMQGDATEVNQPRGVVGQFKPLSWDGGVTKSTSLSTVTEFKRINLPPLMLKLDATLNSVLVLPALHELPA